MNAKLNIYFRKQQNQSIPTGVFNGLGHSNKAQEIISGGPLKALSDVLRSSQPLCFYNTKLGALFNSFYFG